METQRDGKIEGESPRRKWYAAFNMFPFVYLPIVLIVAVACALILPVLRGVGR
jgi:hypothetical protein